MSNDGVPVTIRKEISDKIRVIWVPAQSTAGWLWRGSRFALLIGLVMLATFLTVRFYEQEGRFPRPWSEIATTPHDKVAPAPSSELPVNEQGQFRLPPAMQPGWR